MESLPRLLFSEHTPTYDTTWPVLSKNVISLLSNQSHV